MDKDKGREVRVELGGERGRNIEIERGLTNKTLKIVADRIKFFLCLIRTETKWKRHGTKRGEREKG